MGLENFTSDGNDVSSSSNNNRGGSNTGSLNGSPQDNSPSYATQAFSDMHGVTARQIKYHIKSINAKWIQQFSNKRFDTGEIVMYGYNNMAKTRGKTVAVFTTIQSAIDPEPDIENKDIHIVCWDLENNEALNSGSHVDYEGDWRQDLIDELEEQIEKLDEYI